MHERSFDNSTTRILLYIEIYIKIQEVSYDLCSYVVLGNSILEVVALILLSPSRIVYIFAVKYIFIAICLKKFQPPCCTDAGSCGLSSVCGDCTTVT